ncbi:MAG: GNAT family N-acetyltransferase [Hamadaea sp.]|uniref:GNAT family N-acetyltransferase n=1 Tax=Hamadaea sp. TaxID=2024425 RepID=UPI0017F3BD0F|nr:GNAT family N-acetyltransferase [Hamadaea sp.]NUR52462.1 GNAT family N-acetyltransferase [Hamadaea sp.]NUR74405.1 GNAT family N-acetyltransferase [Hamadaea sp.]NUT22050.1 GNAT family N-acetyltransferase [Hamadaea sp.]
MNDDLDAGRLREIYDAQLRAHVPERLPAGVTVDRDGPLVRFFGTGRSGYLTYRDLGGLDGDELDELIERQVRAFTDRGEEVEWKLHGHDRPADLADRLVAHGFRPEVQETVVIGPAGPLAAAPLREIPGVRLREVTARADLDRIAGMEEEVWGDGSRDYLAEMLDKELTADPDGLLVVVAEADDRVVCAGWTRYVPGTEFATLWGGSTLPEYRGRGIYKAIVEHRARRAIERGYSLLQVDCSPDSRPILERVGLIPVATTTPYMFRPDLTGG